MTQVELVCSEAIEYMKTQPRDRFDLVFGSPPYLHARTYGIGATRDCQEWIDWMLEVSSEASRICKGAVVWVVGSETIDRCYQPAPEGLMYLWWKMGGDCQLYRPCVYYRIGIPGSGGDQWFRSDWEYIICMKRRGPLPWADNTACGHPPKYPTGGRRSNRNAEGIMANKSKSDGRRQLPKLANPGNVFYFVVGGGSLGDELAHENEAPMHIGLAEIFVRSCCPPGGWVLDPFCGSGTTCEAAQFWGRNCVGVDIRESQIELTRRRLRWGLVV